MLIVAQRRPASDAKQQPSSRQCASSRATMLATAGHVAYPAAQQLARSGATSGATSRDQHGRDARPSCISCATSGATSRNDLCRAASSESATSMHRPQQDIRALALIPLLGNRGGSGSRLPARQRKNKFRAGRRSIQFKINHAMTIHRVFLGVTFLATRAWLRPVSRGKRHFTVGGGRLRQSGPQPEGRLLRQPALEGLTRSVWTDSPRQVGRNKFRRSAAAAAFERGEGAATFELGLGFIGYPRISASGESSTTIHRLLHASGSHPIPPPDDPKTNQYNQDLGLIHSTNGNHLESPNEGSSIDHQVLQVIQLDRVERQLVDPILSSNYMYYVLNQGIPALLCIGICI
ncbi:hypothetical protein F511_22417 [Dorcoceras hygrometricum]|uniref:Uncharacterized protein n=1 Tax=Dorcoceras hygrometricum TaxID=472368 RepID=A0A2Z7BNS4_9LAMI|nr:hypothetical protein F511_22417 [Dorcoceras hygrometricum]